MIRAACLYNAESELLWQAGRETRVFATGSARRYAPSGGQCPPYLVWFQ